MINKTQTCLVVPDLHVPFHDCGFVALTTKLVKLLQPDHVVQLGDMNDFFQISRFSKDPERRETIYEDLQTSSKILDDWQAAAPFNCRFHLVEGNHEYRLSRFSNERAPQLSKMIKSIPEVYRLSERNKKQNKGMWTWHPIIPWNSCAIGDVVFTHGHYFNTHAAAGNLQKYPCKKLITGHTHRVQIIYSEPDRFSVTLGYGADISKLDYVMTPTPWRTAMGVVTFFNGTGSFELVEVNGQTAYLRGEKIIV